MKINSKKRVIQAILVGTFLVGVLWQFVMVQSEKEKYDVPGEYVNLNTYQAHYYTKGQGDLVFCFITGSGTPCAYTDFYALQNRLADIGQTITFDHAGSGWSTATQAPRTIENLIDELSMLIDTVAHGKKVILLCHSLGSLEAIGYAQTHPDRVKGIIFLDSGSPEFYSTDSELLAKIMNRCTALMRTIGINRLLGNLGILLPLYGEDIRNASLSGEVKEIDKAMYYRFAGNPSTFDSIELMNENAKKVLQGPKLDNVPILVISSDSGEAWDKVQKQLAHYVYWSNDTEIINSIIEFILLRHLSA